MSQQVIAIFDGQVFRPETLIALPPNSRVTLTFEPEAAKATAAGEDPYAFLKILSDADVEGPPDWSKTVNASAFYGR